MKYCLLSCIKRLILESLLLLCPVLSFADFPDYYFKQLSLQEGLSQATVKCVLKDYKGIIWIGTRIGLNRFDQYELKNYFHNTQDAHSIPNNSILMLEEDSLRNLWVGTQEGLALYNRGKDNFTWMYDGKYPIQAHAACPVKDGVLFAGVGLYKYSYADKQIHHLSYTNRGETISDYFVYIREWKTNLFVVGTNWKGVYLYNALTNQLTPFNACKESHITSYFIDKNKNLWLSPYGKGVVCYNVNGEEVAYYSTQNSKLSNDVVLDICSYGNELWMATDGGGISRLNFRTKTFQTIENQKGNICSFPVNSVLSLYVDHSNNVWAGTIRGGLLNVREVYMRTFQDTPLNNIYGLSNKTVLCIYEDNGHIYVGTDGGGINLFNPYSNTFKHYSTCSKEKVVSITGYSESELLVSFFGKGLFILNKQTGNYRPCLFLESDTQKKINDTGISINVNRFAPGKFQILAEQAYIYNQDIRKLLPVPIRNLPKNAEIPPIKALNVIYSTDSVTYLFGINNIFHLNNNIPTLSPIYYAPTNLMINDVCSDKKGNFWMATSRGLMLYSQTDGSTKRIDTNLFDEAQVVLYDPAGRLWIGAKGMLFAYTMDTKTFTIYGQSDGVLTNEYIAAGNLRSPSGDIYLGGVTGLLHIAPNFQIKNTSAPSIELMDIQLNGVTITNQLSAEGKLTLPQNYNSLVIKLVSNEENIFRHKLYRFHISGFSKDIESYAPTLALYSLPTGVYDINVSCSNSDGRWTSPVRILTLTIPTPWWKSSFSMVGLVVLIIIICFLYISYANRKKERKLRWEMKEQREKMNEEKVQFLINMSHELCTPLMLIYAPIKRLLNKGMVDNPIQYQLENICKQVKRMKSLINMVLDVRRIEMGQKILYPSTHLLNEWLKDVAGNFNSEYQSKDIQLAYNLDNTINEWTFDANKSESIVSNLLMNAFKFSIENSTVTLTTRREANCVSIAISDEGIGLSDKDIQQLFVRFYQGDQAYEGNGIGLSYVKTLVELQGGNIKAYNNKNGKGATFIFELPEIQIEKQQLAQRPNISLNDVLRFTEREVHQIMDEEPFDTLNYSVLLVEDNTELCLFLKESLQEYFQKVYTANSGKDAFDIACQKLPDVVVSEGVMQRGNGLELCRQLKKQETTIFIPIVLLTAQGDTESTTLGYNSGADIYLTKPCGIEELIVILRSLLKNRKQIQTHYRNKSVMQTITPTENNLSNTDEVFTLKLNHIITDNLSNFQMDTDFLAEQMGMSRTSLYNRIRAILHVSISDYINNFRIEKALQMLRNTNCSILEISEAIGFSNQRYFSTFFKKMVGCTPSKYREENSLPSSKTDQ